MRRQMIPNLCFIRQHVYHVTTSLSMVYHKDQSKDNNREITGEYNCHLNYISYNFIDCRNLTTET